MSEQTPGPGTPAAGRQPGEQAGAARPARTRSARRQFCSTILALEVLVVLFAALVAFGLRLVETVPLTIGAGALGLSLVLAAGLQGRPGGVVVGSVLQAPLPLAGLWVREPILVVVGVLFAILWAVAVRLGGRIDRERAAWAAGHAPSR